MSRLNTSVNSAASLSDKARYVKCLTEFSKIMDIVQSDVFDVKKPDKKIKSTLFDQVQKLTNQVGLKLSCEVLFRMMVVPFQAKDSENPFAVKLIAYFFMLITDERWGELGTGSSPNDTVVSLNTSVSSLTEDGFENFPLWILKLCERYHDDPRVTVRLRIMQTVETLVPDTICITELKRTYQARFVKMCLTRSKDKSDSIRAIAVRNLGVCLGEEAPFRVAVCDVIIERMNYDPSHLVRAKAVEITEINDETLEYVVQRCGDINTVVKVCALKRVGEKVKLADLTFEMREAILKANITDDTPKAVEKAISDLLTCWLNSLDNDVFEFLRILNVRKRRKLCKKTLDAIYNQPEQEAYEVMAKVLLNDKRYPEESISVEGTFMWLYMYQRFKDDPYIYNKLAISAAEMIDYIKEFIEVVEEEGDLPQAEFEYRSWILGDLLQILVFVPVEEGERKGILEFLPTLCLTKNLMDERNSALVMKLISVCSTMDDEITVIELVNHIMDAERPSKRRSESRSRHTTPGPELDSTRDRLKLELGNLVHKKKKLEREKQQQVQENKFEQAQVCQDEIEKLDAEISKIKENIEHFEEISNMSLNTSNLDDSRAEAEEPWTYSDKTLLVVLSLIKGNILSRNCVTACSRTFYEMYAVKAVSKSRDPRVRGIALELMCLVSLDFEEELPKATLYCLIALLRDVTSVKISALKCLFDLVLCYSFSQVTSFPQVQAVFMGSKEMRSMDIKTNPEDHASTLKSLLLTYIRDEELALVKVCVAGVLKLLFRKAISTKKVITTLLFNWAIPSQYFLQRFKDIGAVLPVYATVGENEAIEVAECLISVIKKAIVKKHMRAESDQIIPQPDIDKIISFIVKCTEPKVLQDFQRSYIAHETIAIGALKQLQDVELITEEKMHYCKVLKVLDLSLCPPESISQMLHTLSDIAEHASRTINVTLKGFTTYLESLHGGKVERPQNVEEEAVENNDDDMDTTGV